MNILNILYTVILYPLVQVIEISFKLLDKLFDNTGIAVLGVSLTVTLLCLPLYIVAENWQDKERAIQAALKPGIERIKKFFKGDEQYMILSTFYRQSHYHPIMALRSSFGILIQIPFFLAAYHTLSSLPDLHEKAFLFIKDMGRPDAVFSIGNFSVNILPIAMTAINCISGAIYSKGHGIREKIQIYGMAAVFLVVLYNSPAGLVLYWTMNNVFSLIKNIFYKMKNPLKVLYCIMTAAIVAVSIFVLFIYDGGANMKKRLACSVPLLILIFLPLYLRLTNALYRKFLSPLYMDKKFRFLVFISAAAALCVLFGLAIPSSIIASSTQEFSNIDSYTNPAGFLFISFWQSFGIFIFWPLCIFLLFGKRIQSILAAFFSVLFFCGIVNAYIFAGDYGSMDPTLRFIDGIQTPGNLFTMLNALCIVVTAVIAVLIISVKKHRIASGITFVAFLSLALMALINISKITSEYKDFTKIAASGNDINPFEPKFHLSKDKKNVVLIMIDRAESSFFESICNDMPELKDMYHGFVYYPNTVSFNGHTLMGSPAVYGGYDYTPAAMNARKDIPLKEKHNESLLMLPKILTEQAGFKAYLSDLSWGNYSYISDMSFTKNLAGITGYKLEGKYTSDFKKEIPSEKMKVTLSSGIERNLIWVSLFRSSPAAVRPAIYYRGSWWAAEKASDLDSILNWFSELYFLPRITDYSSQNETLTVITNETTHSNTDLSPLETIDKSVLKDQKTAAYYNYAAVLMAIGKWLDSLKENKAYDNTRIIIVSDHGIGYSKKSDRFKGEYRLDGYSIDHLNPTLLVKDFGSNSPLRTDMKFMTNADCPAIALDGIIENPVNPYTGNPITQESKKDGVIVTTENLFMPYHSKSSYTFTVSADSWYKVKDNIFNIDNWSKLN